MKVAIVGGGAAAAWLVLRLLREGIDTIDVVEPRPEIGRGLAYATRFDGHLLNVPASKMDFETDAGDPLFADHLAKVAPDLLPDGYAPRRLYGDFLEQVLDEAIRDRPVRHRMTRARALRPDGRGFRLDLETGEVVAADAVVLALGNLPAHPLAADIADPRIVEDPWVQPVPAGRGRHVLVAGTGLTALDAAISIVAADPDASFTFCAKRPLFPPVDRLVEAWPGGADLVGVPPARAMAVARAAIAAGGKDAWYAVVDGIRPHVEPIWNAWSIRERRSFWHHAARIWLHHRHRAAPGTAAVLDRLGREGRVEIAAGRLSAVEAGPAAVEAMIGARRVQADLVVNATGPSLSLETLPFLRETAATGLVSPALHGLGIATNRSGQVLDKKSRPVERLYALGPLTRGTFFEVVAVPHIRRKAGTVAHALAGVAASSGRR